jgi:hypothetical protein
MKPGPKPKPYDLEAELARFWALVDRSGECWLWLGSQVKAPRSKSAGYGLFVRGGRRGHVLAHKYALELKLGRSLGLGMKALHTCDNPPCARPDHLFEGTQADNIADMVAKGRARGAPGESNASAKLTEADVVVIRALRDRETAVSIARRYGVSAGAVGHVLRGRNWQHVSVSHTDQAKE